MASPIDRTLKQLSEEVDEHNARASAQEEKVTEAKTAHIVKKTRESILSLFGIPSGVGVEPRLDRHKFVPYGNPDNLTGCVRCRHPKDHPVHDA